MEGKSSEASIAEGGGGEAGQRAFKLQLPPAGCPRNGAAGKGFDGYGRRSWRSPERPLGKAPDAEGFEEMGAADCSNPRCR